jgi:flagellar biosynthetic protein FliR
MLVVNVVLGVLAKAAPQMNMFVIGIQLKVIVGLLVLFLIVQSIPSVSDFIMNEMKDMMSQAIRAMTPK